MIELTHISKSYPPKTVIQDLSFRLPERGIFCLMGPSGCGKTTLLKMIAGLEDPSNGTLTVDVAKKAMVFQEDRLVPWLTSEENIRLVLSKGENSSFLAQDLLASLGLQKAANALPGTLSGGMKRRVSLARALAVRADLLLLDEPFTGLDDESKKNAAALIRKEGTRALVIAVTHNAENAGLLDARILRCAGAPLSELLPE